MRPVERGPAPRVYTDYKQARPDLEERLGKYCSYCERQIETHLAIEHILPRVQWPSLQNEWSNFLLACVHCNSNKGKKHVARSDYFWPDRDNTLRAFDYLYGGEMRPHPSLASGDQARAKDTMLLTGLDRFPGNNGREPSVSDYRWLRRQQAWQLAKKCRTMLLSEDTTAIRDLIVLIARSRGMFSIWWSAFDGDVDMRQRLRSALPGTHAGSFDAGENPRARVGGLL